MTLYASTARRPSLVMARNKSEKLPVSAEAIAYADLVDKLDKRGELEPYGTAELWDSMRGPVVNRIIEARQVMFDADGDLPRDDRSYLLMNARIIRELYAAQ